MSIFKKIFWSSLITISSLTGTAYADRQTANITVTNTPFNGGAVVGNITGPSYNSWVPAFGLMQDSAKSANIVAGSAAYVKGDSITLNDGCSIHGTVIVNNVSGGVITGFNIGYPGNCLNVPTNPVVQLSTSGIGTGGSFNLTWGPLASFVPNQQLTTGGGNLIMNSPVPSEIGTGVYGGSESVFLGERSGLKVVTGDFDIAIGHNTVGVGGGCSNIYADSITAVGTDALRNLCGGARATVFGASALKNYTQIGTSANHFLFGIAAFGSGAMVNFNGAVGFPWDTAVGDGACAGAVGTAAFTNGTCVGSNTGANLTTANNFLILAGGGNGRDTCSSCSGVIDILSGAVTSTLSATATNTVNIENVFTVTGTNVPSTSTTSIAGTLTTTNSSGYKLTPGATSGTAPSFSPNASDIKSGIGADIAGDVSIITNNGGTATEAARFNGVKQSIAGRITVGSITAATGGQAGDFALTKETDAAAAPGATFTILKAVAGTNAGTCKLITYAGTSTTPVTIIDNIGGGC